MALHPLTAPPEGDKLFAPGTHTLQAARRREPGIPAGAAGRAGAVALGGRALVGDDGRALPAPADLRPASAGPGLVVVAPAGARAVADGAGGAAAADLPAGRLRAAGA